MSQTKSGTTVEQLVSEIDEEFLDSRFIPEPGVV